jgi:hypothetical protein
MSTEEVTFVRWTIPQCTRTFGVGPCTAALSTGTPNKCFNMFKHCADKANYDAGELVLTFTPGNSGLPESGTVFALIDGITETEATVNLAGSDKNMSAFGRRATGKVTLHDQAYHDRALDKYAEERVTGAAQFSGTGYRPEDRGMVLAKMRQRYPYYAGSKIEAVDGRLEGGVFIEEETREYIVTAFEVTTPGRAEIEFKDILDVAGNTRAVAPKQSNGRLLTAIGTGLGITFELTPTGIGDAEYPATGRAAIGSEVVSYTRSGDIITLTGRGLGVGANGTAIASHSALDTFQQTLRFDRVPVDVVYKTLLTEFAPVPAAYWPDAAAAEETEIWGAGQILDAEIVTPTPVSDLVAEIAPLGSSVWWEAADKMIGFKINRPPYLDTVWKVTDDDIFSITKEDREKDRVTDVIFRTVQIDPTRALSQDNFLRGELIVDGDAKDPRAYGDQRIKETAIRWMNQGADNSVRIAAIRYLQRFSSAPTRVDIVVPRAKFNAVRLADVVELTTTASPDEFGLPLVELYQVISRKKVRGGRLGLKLQRYFFDQGNRPAYFMEDDTPDYDDASDEDKALGWFFTSEDAPEFEPYTFQ